jgi:hypothetical protein
MNTQYTPSHWINDGTEISACVDPAVSRSYIAPICSLDTDWHPDIVAANARLIAAAPDLLAALQMVNRIWSHDQTANLAPDSPVAIVRAAITKATGEN